MSISAITNLSMSRTGDMLLACSLDNVHAIQCNASTLLCSHGDDIAYLSSRRNVIITDAKRQKSINIQIDHDLQNISLGPHHLAISNMNFVHIYGRGNHHSYVRNRVIELIEAVVVSIPCLCVYIYR